MQAEPPALKGHHPGRQALGFVLQVDGCLVVDQIFTGRLEMHACKAFWSCQHVRTKPTAVIVVFTGGSQETSEPTPKQCFLKSLISAQTTQSMVLCLSPAALT